MEFVNHDGTSEKATAEDLLRMAGIAKPELKPCTIPEALETIEGLIDGEDPEEDPLTGMLTPIHRLLLRLQIDSTQERAGDLADEMDAMEARQAEAEERLNDDRYEIDSTEVKP